MAEVTLGGKATSASGSQVIFGPATAASSKSAAQIQAITLESGVELKVKLPAETTQIGLDFPTAASGTNITIKTNFAGDGVMTINTEGPFTAHIPSSATELAFKAVTAPKTFDLYTQ